MAVSFGLKSSKRQKLATTESFSGADLPEALPPVLSHEEAVAESRREQELGAAHAADRSFLKALKRFNRAITLTPSKAELHEMKAQALMELDDVWAAMQSAKRATELAPEWPEAHLTMGRANLELGEPELALSNMEEALRLQPSQVEAGAEISTVRMLVQQRKQQMPGGGQRLQVVQSAVPSLQHQSPATQADAD